MFDATQSYFIPMLVVAIASMAGSTMFLFLDSPRKSRPSPPGENRRRRSLAAAAAA